MSIPRGRTVMWWKTRKRSSGNPSADNPIDDRSKSDLAATASAKTGNEAGLDFANRDQKIAGEKSTPRKVGFRGATPGAVAVGPGAVAVGPGGEESHLINVKQDEEKKIAATLKHDAEAFHKDEAAVDEAEATVDEAQIQARSHLDAESELARVVQLSLVETGAGTLKHDPEAFHEDEATVDEAEPTVDEAQTQARSHLDAESELARVVQLSLVQTGEETDTKTNVDDELAEVLALSKKEKEMDMKTDEGDELAKAIALSLAEHKIASEKSRRHLEIGLAASLFDQTPHQTQQDATGGGLAGFDDEFYRSLEQQHPLRVQHSAVVPSSLMNEPKADNISVVGSILQVALRICSDDIPPLELEEPTNGYKQPPSFSMEHDGSVHMHCYWTLHDALEFCSLEDDFYSFSFKEPGSAKLHAAVIDLNNQAVWQREEMNEIFVVGRARADLG